MSMPRFTAEKSIYETISHFRFEAAGSFGSKKKDNQVYMQKPNNQNTPGGKCHATTLGGDTVNVGTYNADGYCCGPRVSGPSGQLCINCDNGFCEDGVKSLTLGTTGTVYRFF